MDLKTEKISNIWILAGWIIGLIFQIASDGINGSLNFASGSFLPVVLLSPLFLARMLGAGDIKLLSVLGGFMGLHTIFFCTIYSFIFGAVISFSILIYYHFFLERLLYFFNYFKQCITQRQRIPYRQSGRRRPEHFHFSTAILIGTLLWIGGIY